MGALLAAARLCANSGFTKGSQWLRRGATHPRVNYHKPQTTEFCATIKEPDESSKVAGIAVWSSVGVSRAGLYYSGTVIKGGEKHCAGWWLCRRSFVSFPCISRCSRNRRGVLPGFWAYCSLLASKKQRGVHLVGFCPRMLLYIRIPLLGSAFYRLWTSTDHPICSLSLKLMRLSCSVDPQG